jgi:hypothetical protein
MRDGPPVLGLSYMLTIFCYSNPDRGKWMRKAHRIAIRREEPLWTPEHRWVNNIKTGI